LVEILVTARRLTTKSNKSINTDSLTCAGYRGRWAVLIELYE